MDNRVLPEPLPFEPEKVVEVKHSHSYDTIKNHIVNGGYIDKDQMTAVVKKRTEEALLTLAEETELLTLIGNAEGKKTMEQRMDDAEKNNIDLCLAVAELGDLVSKMRKIISKLAGGV